MQWEKRDFLGTSYHSMLGHKPLSFFLTIHTNIIDMKDKSPLKRMWGNENEKYIVLTQLENYRQTELQRTLEISQFMPAISQNTSIVKIPRKQAI